MAVAYAHDQVTVPAGSAGDFLELAREAGGAFYAEHGWRLIGAFETAMRNDDEAFLLWSIPSWERWGAAEAALRAGHPWRDAPACGGASTCAASCSSTRRSAPCALGRQPARSDRDDSWSEE